MRKKKDQHGEPKYVKGGRGDKQHKSKSQHSILHRHQKRLEEFKNKDSKIRAIEKDINNAKKDINNARLWLQTSIHIWQKFTFIRLAEKIYSKREQKHSTGSFGQGDIRIQKGKNIQKYIIHLFFLIIL